MTRNTEVTAIVPTYNEERHRLEGVLASLLACEDIQRVIVVDDGSKEPAAWIEKEYPNIAFIRHAKNKGKGAAMETGVEAAESKYIFFCDADLEGFLPEHASGMIRPVTSGAYRAFIGIRSNPEQRAVFLFALNSGERCVWKEDWESLPIFYKKGFRVETGLNFFVARRGGRLGHKEFSYRQVIKEKKYTLWGAIVGRWHMIYDVGTAWARVIFWDYWTK